MQINAVSFLHFQTVCLISLIALEFQYIVNIKMRADILILFLISEESIQFLITEYNVSYRASLVAQMVKRLPAMQETEVRSLSQEDPLEKEMATYSSNLAWKIPWMEEPVRL